MAHDGAAYKFDFNQIVNLNTQYPFKYVRDVKEFKSKSVYEKYVEKQKSNPKYVFHYRPQFKYEGSFEIRVPKNSFPHPAAVSDYLAPHIEKIVRKGDYLLGYELSEKNMKDKDQYTMTIQGSKKLFEQLKLDQYKNESWQATIENAYFFYKK